MILANAARLEFSDNFGNFRGSFYGWLYKMWTPQNNNNRLLNNKQLTNRACSDRTRGYWPSVVAVRSKRSEVRTTTTKGQYSTVQPEQSRLVSCLLYGTMFFSKMQWHSVSDNKMLQKRFVTESDKSSC